MAAEIGPGTPLICIDDSPAFATGRKIPITKDAMYFCERIKRYPYNGCARDKCNARIWIKGLRKSMCPARFKPLNDGDTSLVEAEKEKEDAIQGGETPKIATPKETKVLEPQS
jgi:hypothetical protein